jgi:hypothetical protein
MFRVARKVADVQVLVFDRQQWMFAPHKVNRLGRSFAGLPKS